jgi:serine protease Do
MSDLALLKLTGTGFPYAELDDSDDLIIGEWVIALGNPFKLFQLNNQPSASIGIVSATNMDFGMQQSGKVFQDMIQTDAAINPGNSGGPLVNSLGKVIGINTFIYRDSELDRGSTGIGFAIPINYAKRVAKELKMTGEIDRNFYTGLIVQPLDHKVARYLDVPFVRGLVILDVSKSSPADNSGLKTGDIILSFNGVEVNKPTDIDRVISEGDIRAGSIVKLKIFRNGNHKMIKMKTAKYK